MPFVPDASIAVRDSGHLKEPLAYRIAPHNRVAGLVVEQIKCLLITLFIDQPMQRGPLRSIRRRGLRPVIVGIVDVLNDGLA